MRLVDEIKNRYKNGDDSHRKSADEHKESVIERIDITYTFENEEQTQRSKEKGRKNNSV